MGILAKDLIKVYHDPMTDVKTSALRGLDLYVRDGEVASVIGPSGSGKSTLIKILSGLLSPSGGSVIIDNVNIVDLNDREMRKFRFEKMGILNQFVHQNLLAHLSVEDNIMLPMKMRHFPREKAKKETKELLEVLNIKKIRNNRVTHISGGEAVRTSIGTVLSKKPSIVLADEPTGQLDTANTNDIIATFKDLNDQYGTSILVVTHDLRFRNAFKKSYIIRDGRLVGVNIDLDRDELDFILKPQESSLQSVIDSSQFVRLPDAVYASGGFKHITEFEIHPSKKFSVIFNPDEVTREEVYEEMEKTEEYLKERGQGEGEGKVSFKEVQPILEQEFIPKDHKEIAIHVKNLKKSFRAGRFENEVLKGLSYDIRKGQLVVISGKSGAGKTTMMNVLSGVEKPDEGIIKVNDFEITQKDRDKVSAFRFYNIAMISQVNNLLDQYLIRENMYIPSLFNDDKQISKEKVEQIAKECNIYHKLDAYPPELSGGEKQRAALAVALARHTPLIFADEPTANLDTRLARELISLLMETSVKYDRTIIMSTHDLSLVRPGFRLISLQNGEITDDFIVTKQRLKGILEKYLDIEIEDESN